MIHVVTAHNRPLYIGAITETHRLRRAHFVDIHGWAGPPVRNGAEYDAHDDDDVIYLLHLETDGSLSCSMGLRPVQPQSALAGMISQLAADADRPLSIEHLWEFSRCLAVGRARGSAGARRRAEIRLAALEVALARGARRLVGTVEPDALAGLANSSGWRVREVGAPALGREGAAQTVQVDVSVEAVGRMREVHGITARVALELDGAGPAHLPPHEIAAFIALARHSGSQRVLGAIVRRIAELQDTVPEDELLALVTCLKHAVAEEVSAPRTVRRSPSLGLAPERQPT